MTTMTTYVEATTRSAVTVQLLFSDDGLYFSSHQVPLQYWRNNDMRVERANFTGRSTDAVLLSLRDASKGFLVLNPGAACDALLLRLKRVAIFDESSQRLTSRKSAAWSQRHSQNRPERRLNPAAWIACFILGLAAVVYVISNFSGHFYFGAR